MATWRKGKAVLVTRHVLIEPRRAEVDHHHHHDHDHQVHHTAQRESGLDGKRFINRRAELLQYSQRLRESAKPPDPEPSTPLLSSSSTHHKPQIFGARRKTGSPTCLGNCNIMLPNFFKLLKLRLGKKNEHRGNTRYKIKSVLKIFQEAKRFQLQKRRNFFSKLSLTSRKQS